MPQPKKKTWVNCAQQMVAERTEALEFISRVKEQMPQARRRHAAAVTNLWFVADGLDRQMGSLLLEMNQGLLKSAGQQDVTRGAGVDSLGENSNTFSYNCAWLLKWDPDLGIIEQIAGFGIAVELAIEPDSEELFLHVVGSLSAERIPVEYPFPDVLRLQEVLIKVFVSESTANQFPDLRDTSDNTKYRTESSEFMDEFQQLLAQHENQPPLP